MCGGTAAATPSLRTPTRSIPACAGEPAPASARSVPKAVYPRVCGGTSIRAGRGSNGCGLSPRVRGNPSLRRPTMGYARSIPACAGEPRIPHKQAFCRKVYPRVCGGTTAARPLLSAPRGLSPRVRGNLKPVLPSSVTMSLSPRVRGNRPGGCRGLGAGRSIPACAGEPAAECCGIQPRRVYPRVCGGTAAGQIITKCPGVYPRVCGGTVGQTIRSAVGVGLSPRVRGNRRADDQVGGRRGSIPACAGEPTRLPRVLHASEVYPRVCGGTARAAHMSTAGKGLSPRVRGNLHPLVAGGVLPVVYPRVCGGTTLRYVREMMMPGLSPRVRGNHGAESR